MVAGRLEAGLREVPVRSLDRRLAFVCWGVWWLACLLVHVRGWAGRVGRVGIGAVGTGRDIVDDVVAVAAAEVVHMSLKVQAVYDAGVVLVRGLVRRGTREMVERSVRFLVVAALSTPLP